MPQADGVSLYEHLKRVEKLTGRQPKELKGPLAPEAGGYLVSFLDDLSTGRQYGPNGPLPLSHMEIHAWSQLQRITLLPWELEALKALDRAYLEAWFDNRKVQRGAKP